MDLGILWMDTDVVVLHDPFPLLRDLLAANGAMEGVHLLASVDGRVPDENLHECSHTYSNEARWGKSAGVPSVRCVMTARRTAKCYCMR